MSWLSELVSFATKQIDERVLEALNARGVSDSQVELFQIGYLNKALPSLEFPEDFLSWSKEGANLSDVLVFPLTNVLGEILAIQLRYVDRDKKGYMDYFLPSKGEAVMFGLHQAMPHIWRSQTALLVEGVFDLLPCQRFVPGIISTMTARVPEELVWLLRRVCKWIKFAYDSDIAGKLGVERFRKAYRREFEIDSLKYPNPSTLNGKSVKDPGELWELRGDSGMKAFLLQAHTEGLTL